MSKDFQIGWDESISLMGVYLIECLPTGQVYVGQSRSIRRRWGDHRKRISASQRGVLRGPLSEEHRRAIAEGNKGYIPTAAIESHRGPHQSAETKQKIGNTNRGRKWTAEQRARISGRVLSEEHIKKMSEARKGVPWTPARREAQAKLKEKQG